ncbi:MAG: hypothetical protein ACRC5T_01530 [Cetobacterium sp.]
MKNKFFLEFSSQLLKEERNILRFFIESHLKKQNLEFRLEELDIPKLKNCKKNYLERLGKKGVFFIKKNIEKIYCPFFNSLHFSQDTVKIFFNKEFLEYMIDNEKIFNYSLKEVLYLKNNFSVEFFYKILKDNILKDNLKINVEILKDILTIESYSRIYDLKRFVLLPLIEDINKNTDFEIDFSLVKENGVWEVIFLIKNSKVENLRNYTKSFIRLYKNYIIDKKRVAFLIFNAINAHDYGYVKSKILFAIKNNKKYNLNFDELLEGVLCDKMGEFYILLKSHEIKAQNIDIFRNAIHKEISPLAFSEISTFEYNTNLAKQLYALKPNQILILISESLKLELLFNPESISKIAIYKRYIKYTK